MMNFDQFKPTMVGGIVAGLMLVAANSLVADEASMLRDLIDVGVPLDPTRTHPLPPPLFITEEGQAIDEPAAATELKRIAGPMGVDRFTKDSIVAPIDIRIASIENDAGVRIGHQLDVVFVVHAPISELRGADAVKNIVGGTPRGTEKQADDPAKDSLSQPLSDEQIQTRGLVLKDRQDVRRIRFPLLDQVIIEGVAIAERSVWPEKQLDAPVVFTWRLDPRFSDAGANGADLQSADLLVNRWRAIGKGDRGQTVLGPRKPYSGIGGYLALSPLPGLSDVTIFQACLVIHEPVDWFAGRNQLRSKLPLIVQDRVRDLRRELKK